MSSEFFRFFQFIGLILITLGAILFILPILLEKVPALEKIPWITLYVYRTNGFIFVTSPILIIVSVISLFWSLITQVKK
jgi:hypothetical protein